MTFKQRCKGRAKSGANAVSRLLGMGLFLGGLLFGALLLGANSTAMAQNEACIAKPTRACVARIGAKLAYEGGPSLADLALVLAETGQHASAAAVAKLAKGENDVWIVPTVAAVKAVQEGRFQDAASLAGKISKPMDRRGIAKALWRADKKKAAKAVLDTEAWKYFFGYELNRRVFLQQATKGNSAAAVQAFRKMAESQLWMLDADGAEYLVDELERLPPRTRISIYPALMKLLKTDPLVFNALGLLTVDSLIALGAGKEAKAILDHFLKAWAQSSARAKPKPGLLIKMAMRYAWAGYPSAIDQVIAVRKADALNRLMLLSLKGDVQAVQSMIEKSKKYDVRMSDTAIAVIFLATGGHLEKSRSLAAAYRSKLKKKDYRYSKSDTEGLDAVGRDAAKVAVGQSTKTWQTTAEHAENMKRPNVVIALLQADAAKSLKARDFVFTFYPHVCSLVRHAYLAGDPKTSRKLASSYASLLTKKAAAEALESQFDVRSVAGCQTNVGDFSGALTTMLRFPANRYLQLSELTHLLKMLP